VDLKEAMLYPFKDPEWLRKAIVGSIIALLAFPLFFLGIPVLFGWGMAIARDVRDGAPPSLPSWSRLTSYFLDGLKPFVATILWLTPGFLLLFISAVLPSGSTSSESAILASTLLFVLAFGLMLIAGFASPFQFGVAAETGSFVSAADPVSVFRFVRSCPGPALAAWLVCVGSYYVLYTLGVLLCVVGCLPALVYQYALWGHAFGQVLRSRKPLTTS
jgi:hypothetical protein